LVKFIGLGPCYCDCSVLGKCGLLDQSVQEADELLGSSCGRQRGSNRSRSCGESFFFDVYQLCPWHEAWSSYLVAQARELVRHSKSTFWLDRHAVVAAAAAGAGNATAAPLSALEQFAWRVFEQHKDTAIARYCPETIQGNGEPTTLIEGAEWWVQVKLDEEEPGGRPDDTTNQTRNADTAIDLHYDKDETMAELFDLGFFPALSTVTYWTAMNEHEYNGAAPTVVFRRHYEDESPETGIREMLMSHPAPGKHLVFDGRLLHGAPAHTGLRRRPAASPPPDDNDGSVTPATAITTGPKLRITFLVNIWVGHRPCDAMILPNEIRERLVHGVGPPPGGDPAFLTTKEPFVFVPNHHDVAEFHVDGKNEAGADHDRIELPFVGGSSTWAGDTTDDGDGGDNDDDDDDSGEDELVVSMVLPPPAVLQALTALVHFDDDSAAFIC
jgi:hypothetical protein